MDVIFVRGVWLVICEPSDDSAIWAAEGLRGLGVDPLVLITSDQLARADRWAYQIGRRGADLVVDLSDGRRIDTQEIQGTLNRLVRPPNALRSDVAPADREYASNELASFFLAWLASLPPPVINPATAEGLAGPWRSQSHWVWLANRAGLVAQIKITTRKIASSIPPGEQDGFSADDIRWAIVVGGSVTGGELPASIQASCLRLAEVSETPLLGVALRADHDRLYFAAATPLPDLRLGGDQLLSALAQELGVQVR